MLSIPTFASITFGTEGIAINSFVYGNLEGKGEAVYSLYDYKVSKTKVYDIVAASVWGANLLLIIGIVIVVLRKKLLII
jgi:hypothetical protein